jgi:hypothetical protein
VLARNPPRRSGRYIRLSRVFTWAVSWATLRLARFASSLELLPHRLDGVQLVRAGR